MTIEIQLNDNSNIILLPVMQEDRLIKVSAETQRLELEIVFQSSTCLWLCGLKRPGGLVGQGSTPVEAMDDYLTLIKNLSFAHCHDNLALPIIADVLHSTRDEAIAFIMGCDNSYFESDLINLPEQIE